MATTGLNRKKMLTTLPKSVLNMRQIATILFYRRFFILGVSCVMISATSLLAVITKPMYQSSMEIMVKDNLEQESSLNQVQISQESQPNSTDISAIKYGNQMELMLSSTLVQKAVDLLRSDYPQITIEDIKGDSETGKPASLNVRQKTDIADSQPLYNQVFLVSFKDPDPVKTKRVLQALQKVYQDYNIEQKKQRVKQGLDFVNHRMPNLQRQTLAAERKLEIFRKKHNLIDPELQGKILLESLADIQKQRRENRLQIEDIQTRYKSLEQKLVLAKQNAQLDNSLNRSSNYQTLVNEIRNTERSLEQERLRYTENSPVIIKLKEKHKIQMALLQEELQDTPVNADGNNSDLAGVNAQLITEIAKLEKQRKSLTNNENNLAKYEEQIRSQLSTYPGLINEYNRLLSDVRLQQKSFEQLAALQQSLGVKISQGGFDLQILEEPDLGIYIGQKKWLLIISGVIIGPVLGAILSLMWETFNQAIFSPVELQKITNIKLLGSVPKLGNAGLRNKLKSLLRQQGKKADKITENYNKLSSNENLDMIYQNLQIFKNSWPFKSLMLTSALPGEGKTTLALGLAGSAANMHQRVLIIDANLRSPQLHKILDIPNEWGLSLLLLDDIKTQFQNYIQPIHPSIDVLTAGPKPDDVVNLLSSGRLKELIATFENIYDLVIIDTSAMLDNVDARIIAAASNGILMVGRIGKLKLQELTQTTEILNQLNLIGIVANGVNNLGVKSSKSREQVKVNSKQTE